MLKYNLEEVCKLHELVNKTRVHANIICKNGEEEQRLFYAVVIEPMTEVTPEGDTHGHVMKAEEIEKSAHYFMEMGSTVFQSHKSKINACVVESYIAPVSFTPDGSDTEITKGSWVMTVKVYDDDVWEGIKSGQITAFSPGGYGKVEDI